MSLPFGATRAIETDAREIEVFVHQPRFGGMPHVRYASGKDWSWLGIRHVHLTANSVKDAAPAILELRPHVANEYAIHVYDLEFGYWIRYKDQADETSVVRMLTKPIATDLRVEKWPRWMYANH
jgi:hypothetical protein